MKIIFLMLSLLHCTFGCLEHTFTNVPATITIQEGNENNVRINGCVEPNNELNNIISIVITNQEIPVLNQEAFTKINTLKSITMSKSGIILIVPGAFVGLSGLRNLDLQDNNILTLTEKAFINIPVENITIMKNNINEIEDGAFKNLPNFRKINLSKNKLLEWNSKWFENTPNLESIILNENQIEELKENAFSIFPKLKVISLRRNNLKKLANNIFTGVLNINKVDFAENQLRQLPTSFVFKLNDNDDYTDFMDYTEEEQPIKLRFLELYLHNNQLSFLPKNLLEDMNHIDKISIHSNPWNCGCYIQMQSALNKNNITADTYNAGCYDIRNPVCVSSSQDGNIKCNYEINNTDIEYYFKLFEKPKRSAKRFIRCSKITTAD